MRNLILLTQTALLAHVEGYTSIVAGFHVEPQESQFVDASKTFAMSMKETLIAAGGPLLEFPFVDRERTDFIREFSAQDPEVITRAFSCYEGIEEECGNCTKCQIKAGILQRIQRKDVS
jgi:7-cyano-7-deazaguanine synthase in queuosine biosynthesis